MCEYCSGQKRMEDTDLFNDFLIDGDFLSVRDEFDTEIAVIGIRYCPWCGRKLGEQAVRRWRIEKLWLRGSLLGRYK